MIHLPQTGYENEPDDAGEVAGLIDRLMRQGTEADCPFCQDASKPWHCGTPGAFRPLGGPGGDAVVRCRRCERFASSHDAQEAHDARLMVARCALRPLPEVAPAESEDRTPLVPLGQGDGQRALHDGGLVEMLLALAGAAIVIGGVFWLVEQLEKL